MCGIFGVATGAGACVGLDDARAIRLRDLLSHRGPGGAGMWRSVGVGGSGGGSGGGQFLLAHRRLAVLDPSPAGAQPMALVGSGGEGEPTAALASDAEPSRVLGAIAYNGELYNDAEIREELSALGVRFVTACDTETVLHALRVWGVEGVARLRGMYALAYVDTRRRELTLARDPLGIKPLYAWRGTTSEGAAQVVFASEPGPIVAHPDVGARPDLVTASAYLTTIRTVLGERTMFAGVRTLLPGEVVRYDLSTRTGSVERTRHVVRPVSGPGAGTDRARAAIVDSVRRHLRSDVPACAMLSGGLDSSIICAIARGSETATAGRLRTYASGHDESDDGDLRFASLVAEHLGTAHTCVPVSRRLFRERWPEMVARMGVPLSTPNEVAINEVARRMRADGRVVALSGEGADELFAGYELPMMQASEFEAGTRRQRDGASTHEGMGGGVFQLLSNAWMPPEAKPLVLRPDVWRGLERDAELMAWYGEEFGACAAGGVEPLQAHLNFHRRVNLSGLLQRLDTATMLEGVEGRTPMADVAVAALAAGLPMEEKFVAGPGGGTKLALRRAFAGVLPEAVVRRPKASFPLPFQQWLEDHADVLRRSSLARLMFNDAAVASVGAEPGRMWNLAWPMINLAMWGERWWGS